MAKKKLSQATIKRMCVAGLGATLSLIPVSGDMSPADEKALAAIVELKETWEKKASAAFAPMVKSLGITPTQEQINHWVGANFKHKDYKDYDEFVSTFETLSTKTLDNPVARLATWLSNKTPFSNSDWLFALVTTPTGKFGISGMVKGESATTDDDARSKSSYIMTEVGLAKAAAFPKDDSNAARLCKALVNDGSDDFTYSLIKAVNGPALNVHKVMCGQTGIDPDGIRIYARDKAYLVPKDESLWRYA